MSPFARRLGLVALVAAAVFAVAAVAVKGPTGTTRLASTGLDVPAPPRPYSDESAWNTPIEADAAIDPRSTELVAGILEGSDATGITSDPSQFTYPVYVADEDTPRHDLPCTWYKCTITHEDGSEPIRVDVLEDVPIPVGARPSAGSDGSMIVIDSVTGAEYDLWQATEENGSWTVANASTYNVTWDGMPTEYGSRGAGVPYLAGLVRHEEILAGTIEHALAFAYPNVAADGCVWPASKTDGTSTSFSAIPEGARLQLDPTITDDEFARMGLDRTGRVIAHALQTYGMYLIDVSGRPKIMIEDLSANPFATVSWDDAKTPLSDDTIAAIPVDAFRVLALPDGYTNPGSAEPLHGSCFR